MLQEWQTSLLASFILPQHFNFLHLSVRDSRICERFHFSARVTDRLARCIRRVTSLIPVFQLTSLQYKSRFFSSSALLSTKRKDLASALAKSVPTPAKRPWTEEEDRVLLRLRSEGLSWTDISHRVSQHTGIARRRVGCYNRFHNYLNTKEGPPRPNEQGFMPRRAWSPQEDGLLRELRHQGLTFTKVASSIGRSAPSCATRFQALVDPNLYQARPWIKKEDSYILRHVAIYQQRGERPKWTRIGTGINRAAKWVLHRYEHHLDPSIRRAKWTPREDTHVYTSVQGWPKGIPVYGKGLSREINRTSPQVRARYRFVLAPNGGVAESAASRKKPE